MNKNITISKKEYNLLKKEADINKELLISLVKSLEDVKHGRIKPFKRTT
jgi:hypothetical protein